MAAAIRVPWDRLAGASRAGGRRHAAVTASIALHGMLAATMILDWTRGPASPAGAGALAVEIAFAATVAPGAPPVGDGPEGQAKPTPPADPMAASTSDPEPGSTGEAVPAPDEARLPASMTGSAETFPVAAAPDAAAAPPVGEGPSVSDAASALPSVAEPPPSEAASTDLAAVEAAQSAAARPIADPIAAPAADAQLPAVPPPPPISAAPVARQPLRAPPPRPPAPVERARPVREVTAAPRRVAQGAGAAQSPTVGSQAIAAASPGGAPVARAAATDSPILVTAPRYRRPPRPPDYPPQAIDLGLVGTVLVRALVSPEGDTRETRVWRSSGHALLDAAAVTAVRRWAFEPAREGGRAVSAWVEVPVHFRLN